MYGHISYDDQLLLDGWISQSPELDSLVNEGKTPLDLHTPELEDGNVHMENMHCSSVSETLNGDPSLHLEVKAIESSRRMDAFQQQTERISTIDDKIIIDQKDQKTDPMTMCNPITQSLQDEVNIKASSDSSSKSERKRKRYAMEMKTVEDIKRREIERKRAEAFACELSRNRSMFNGNKDTLPSIGKLHNDVDVIVEKLPIIKQHAYDVNTFHPADHDAISVISKHEARIRTTCLMKDIGNEFVNTGAKMIEPFHKNMAPEIIESYEGEIGRPYQRYGGYPTGSAILTGSYVPKTSRSGIKSRNSMNSADQSPH